jgi:signal peptidase I
VEDDETVEPGPEPAPEPAPSPAPALATEPAPDAAEAAPRSKSSHAWRSTLEWVGVIAAALLIALVLRATVVQTFYIPSPSMEPTLLKDDRILVNKLSYKLHAVHRGDIVVFTTPPNVDKSYKDLVKRVVGLPGETVQGKDNKVFINGEPLAEPYLPAGTQIQDFGPEVVPPDSYWVMGDNRTQSVDSRVFHAIKKSTIVGRAFLRIWPLNRIGLL